MKTPLLRDVTVAIITRNRTELLARCLQALVTQTVVPTQIMIIDSSDSIFRRKNKQVLTELTFSSQVITYLTTRFTNFATLRNKALKNVSTRWLAFIDDDCVADKKWLETLHHGISQYPQAVCFLGSAHTKTPYNVFSLVTHVFYRFWVAQAVSGHDINDLEILDTKNCALSMTFLKSKKIHFDEQQSYPFKGAAEDCDLGMQIMYKGGHGYFLKNMKVVHQDPQTLSEYLKKYCFSYLSHAVYERKWKEFRKESSVRSLSLHLFWREFRTKHSIDSILAAKAYILMGVSLVLKMGLFVVAQVLLMRSELKKV